jgi:hypothetical protein
MKVDISRFVVMVAIAALLVAGGSTVAWAACPTSPNYTTDFTNDETCLTLNGADSTNRPIFFPVSGTGPTVLRLTTNTFNRVGSAWFTTQQPVQNGFSTSFQFQFTNPSSTPADGIAFVIQNSGANAIGFIGGNGGALGYGDNDGSTNPSTGEGIPNSIAIEFDTFENSWDPLIPEGGTASHVAIQSCGTGPNTSHHGYLCGGNSGNSSTLGSSVSTNLANGAIHKVTISYTPPSSSGCNGACPGRLHVILDNTDLFPNGVQVDLGNLLSLGNGGTAFVGFTAATGGSFEDQDILNWTFAPQAQSAPITTNTAAVLSFDGGTDNNAYNYNAILTAGGVTSATVTIKPILIDEEACEKLVDANPKFGKAQCFVYQNAGKDSGGNSVDSAVLFELTCPDQPGGTCGDTGPANFFATLGSDFTFSKAENPGFQLLNSTIGPYPGWLKGSGLDPLHPCSPNPDGVTPLFASNQITSFSVSGDPLGTTRGTSGGGGSCWVATFATGGELPPGIKVTSPTFTTYNRNQSVTAAYTCSNPKTSKALPPASAVGPYLTAASCKQSQAPNNNNSSSCSANVGGTITCTGGVDTSVKGLHLFTVTAKDSGGNVNVNLVIYNVK